MTRFWSPTAAPAGRIPGVKQTKSSFVASLIFATSCAEQTTPSRPASAVFLA